MLSKVTINTEFIDKTRLVIFGEFVPGRSWLPFLKSFNLPSGDLSAGATVQALDTSGIRVGPVICFEGLFPDIAMKQRMNGAQLLAVLSVDDWYMGTGAPEQLRSGSVFRAIETGLPLVRSASQGYSMVVDPRGHVITEAPLTKPQAITLDLPLPNPAQGEPPTRYLFSLIALLSIPVLITVRVADRSR